MMNNMQFGFIQKIQQHSRNVILNLHSIIFLIVTMHNDKMTTSLTK